MLSKVVGLDQSLTKVGISEAWSDVDSAEGKPQFRIGCSVYHPKHGPEAPYARLLELHDFYTRLFSRKDVELFALEGYAFSKNNANTSGTYESGGILRLAAIQCQAPLLVITTTQLKMYALGKGNAAKEATTLEARTRFGRQCASNDHADALWIAEIAYHIAADLDGSNASKRKVLDTLRQPGGHWYRPS